MTASLATAPRLSRLDVLRQRESATEAMLRQVDAKLARLGSARRDRAAGPVAPENDAQRP